MIITLQELKERLAASYDEESLLDVLGVDAHDIVEAFSELIEERMEELLAELEGLGGYEDE